MCVCWCQRAAATVCAYTASYERLSHVDFTIRMSVGSSPESEKAKLGRRWDTAIDWRALKEDVLGLLAAWYLWSPASHFPSQHTSSSKMAARRSTQIGLLTVSRLPRICSSLRCGHALRVTILCRVRMAGVGRTPQSLPALPTHTRRCVDFHLNLSKMCVMIRSSEIKKLDCGFARCYHLIALWAWVFSVKGEESIYLPRAVTPSYLWGVPAAVMMTIAAPLVVQQWLHSATKGGQRLSLFWPALTAVAWTFCKNSVDFFKQTSERCWHHGNEPAAPLFLKRWVSGASLSHGCCGWPELPA